MAGTRVAEQPYFHDPAVTRFLVALQEATRATPGGEQQVFIPPPGGEAVEARYHHLVYGPRGSGKSTLLRRLQRDKVTDGNVVAWIDQEVLSGLTYPDVLVSCVEAIMAAGAAGVRRAIREERGKWWRFWERSKRSDRELLAALEQAASNLSSLKHSPNDRRYEWTVESPIVV